MILDLSKCRKKEGCTACQTACHLAHNVPAVPDPHRQMKWTWKEPFEAVFPTQVHDGMDVATQWLPVPVLCNHCADAPCTRVCPTGATFSRPDGIVVMDDHRCIGCRYCLAACPYGARSFNFEDPRPFLSEVNPDYPTRTRGVVEKCTFCVERVDEGGIPACVEACPARALVFGDVTDPALASLLSNPLMLRRRPELGTKPHVFYVL